MMQRLRQWWFEFQLKRGWKQYGRTKPREKASGGGGMGATTKARVTFEAQVIRADGTVEEPILVGQEFKELPTAYLDGLRVEAARQGGSND